MQPFRPRWPDRTGAVFAIAGFSLGMMLLQSHWPIGVQLVTWIVLLVTFVIPFVILELGTGAIFQDSLSESCRKTVKHTEIVGWLAATVGCIGMVLVTNQAGVFLSMAYDSLLAAIGNQPNQLTVQSDAMLAIRPNGGLLAVAIILALVQIRLWRGAPVIAKTAALLVVIGATGVVLITVLLLLRPGAINGLAYLLEPQGAGWNDLWTLGPWVSSAICLLFAWGMGSGAMTAYGSYFNRSSDAIGLGVIAVLIGSLGQCVLFLAFALGQSVIHPGHNVGSPENNWGPYAVGSVLANVGWPAWWSAILTAVWFIALCAFLISALLALIEAVATPIIDKFRIGRERVVPGICLVVFFISALLGQSDRLPTWSLDGLFVVMVLTMILQGTVAWSAMKLDSFTRHLNAYSAFRLSWGWRSSIAIFIPFLGVYLLIEQFLQSKDMVIRLTFMSMTLVAALVVSRLPGRNR